MCKKQTQNGNKSDEDFRQFLVFPYNVHTYLVLVLTFLCLSVLCHVTHILHKYISFSNFTNNTIKPFKNDLENFIYVYHNETSQT